MIEAALFGSLSRDGEVKTSKAGKPYLRLNVRVGEGEAAEWINITAFDERAIAAADKLVKGARIYAEGKLSLDEWTAQDGTKRHSLSLVSWHCRLSEIGRNRPKRERKPGERPRAPAPANGRPFNDDLPF